MFILSYLIIYSSILIYVSLPRSLCDVIFIRKVSNSWSRDHLSNEIQNKYVCSLPILFTTLYHCSNFLLWNSAGFQNHTHWYKANDSISNKSHICPDSNQYRLACLVSNPKPFLFPSSSYPPSSRFPSYYLQCSSTGG